MDFAPDIATTLDAWLKHFTARPVGVSGVSPAPTLREVPLPADPSAVIPALAALAAEALARDRSLWIVTADDALLPDISNALDLRLRPLCLVLPGAEYAGRIALRATLSLLKSRLARDAQDSAGPAWTAMRERLQTDDALWRACLAWSARGLDREAPPDGIGTLFPVRIGPWPRAERLAAPADWVMLIQSWALPTELRTPWAGAQCTLMLGGRPITGGTGLAVIDESARLRAELEVLGQELAEMELEFATAQGELAAFTERYHAQIAGRMAELDRVQADLAQARMRRTPADPSLDAAAKAAEARAEQSRRERRAYAEREDAMEPPPERFAPSVDLKKRFRQLAQKIHPDRASDDADRAWRTQLMAEANRAYRNGDAIALDEVLSLWLEGPQGGRRMSADENGAVSPAPTSCAVEALTAEVARIRQRIAAIAAELDKLYGSKLYELFAAARIAERQGRDLLQEMAERIDAQTEIAKTELDAIEPAGEPESTEVTAAANS
jgi:hypothetical protein